MDKYQFDTNIANEFTEESNASATLYYEHNDPIPFLEIEKDRSGEIIGELDPIVINGFIEQEDRYFENSNELSDHEKGSFDLNDEIEPEDNNSMGEVDILTSSFFPPEKNVKATSYNQSQVQKSGLTFADIIASIGKHVNITGIRQALISYNRANPSATYRIDASGAAVVDSVFTEAVHQFQMANYLNPTDHDGVIGQSTLETLGFINHGLRHKLSGLGLYGYTQLIRSDVKSQVPILTNNEFSVANWYQYIMKPSWLGVKITDGIHILLLRKLREAETWLLSQPQYKGMTPAALGRTLGFNAGTRYSGARLSSEKQAMHGFGLALDINVFGNPWIGAGWVKYDKTLLLERTRMLRALKNAAGNQSLPGNNVFEYLHSIAQTNGDDTAAAYNTLKQRNDEFISYLRNNSSELSYWRNSQSFGSRDPLNGFLNLHPDLVYALRQIAGLAWGAMDFGPRASGDIMHFDLRTIGIGKFLCDKIGGFVPVSGHPAVSTGTVSGEITFEEAHDHESGDETEHSEHHEAVEEASWEDTENQMNYFAAMEENDPQQEHYESEEQQNNEEYNSEENTYLVATNNEAYEETYLESTYIEDTFAETETGWWSKHRLLNKGDRGEDVGRAQKTLDNNWGITVKVTKVYDDDTVAAVKKFQQMQGLEEDGKMGPFTHAALFESNYRYAIKKPKIIVQTAATCWAASIESASASWKGRTKTTVSSLLSKYKSLLESDSSISLPGLAAVLKDFNVANIMSDAKDFRIEIAKRQLLATGSHLLIMYTIPGASLAHIEVVYGFGVRKGAPYLLTMDPLSGTYAERAFEKLQNGPRHIAIAWPN